jgi:hypothetical protein
MEALWVLMTRRMRSRTGREGFMSRVDSDTGGDFHAAFHRTIFSSAVIRGEFPE